MIRRRYFLMLIALFAASAAWAVGEPAAEELTELQRRRLAELRKHPEQLARLRENVKALLDLPESRRAAIYKLDRELHELPSKRQERLQNTLERYVDWLERLRTSDPPAFKAIKDAPDAATRLTLIKERRDRDWMTQQPRSQRDEWAKLNGAARVEFVAALRQKAMHKHEQWLIAKRFWKELDSKQPMPSRLGDYSEKVKKYVDEYLLPTLTPEEKAQLTAAESKWPEYPQALVEIASKRPSALPPEPPRKLAQLPDSVRNRLTETKKGAVPKKLDKVEKELRSYEGPNFASKVVAVALRDNKLPLANEYLASNFKSLLPPMQDFYVKKLDPVLDQEEKRKLTDSEGKWPEYPETIQMLAKKHDLRPPWHILPEADKWKWDLYRLPKYKPWGAEVAKEMKIP